MKIAFDIQTSIGGRNTGVGVYTSLMREYLKKEEVDVFELRRSSEKPIVSAFSRAWWEQVQMPSYASLTNADVLFSPGFSAQPPKGMPLAITVHDLIPIQNPFETGRFNRWYWQKIVPASWEKADLRICVSYETKRVLKKLFPKIGKTIVVQHGLSKDFSKKKEKKKDYLLMVGAWPRRKNFLSVVHAMFSIKNSPKLKVVGSLPKQLAKSAKDLLGDKVEFEGYVEKKEIVNFYREAIGVICPSISEGFGFVPMEAAACGAPVLMSDIPSHREALPAVEPYGKPTDKNALPKAINELILNPSRFTPSSNWIPKRANESVKETLNALKTL